jgi:hypothetical protein
MVTTDGGVTPGERSSASMRRLILGVHMLRLRPLVCVIGVLQTGILAAQEAPISWQPLSHASVSSLYATPAAGPLSPRAFIAESADTVVRQIKPTYWKEGGIVGAVAVGAFGGWLVHGLCRDSESGGDCTGALVGGALGGGLLGFLTGALIGGQFPKHSEEAPDQQP